MEQLDGEGQALSRQEEKIRRAKMKMRTQDQGSAYLDKIKNYRQTRK
jgi:hypothetical protein